MSGKTFSDYFDDSNKEVMTGALNTDEMGVGNIHHLIERMMYEARPQQFVRELVQNSIESGATEIEISPDWNIVEESEGQTYRFMIADNGQGMDERELVLFMNQISCSGSGVSVYGGNYGIGAKIACLGWNKNGMLVMSWKDGVGRMIRLWKDPQSGKYGLRRYAIEGQTETLFSIIEAPEEYKPAFVKDHGTVIVLCGNEDSEDTWHGPGNNTAYGHISELNTRYFEINGRIKVRVHALPADRNSWPKTSEEINRFTTTDIQQAKRSGWSGTYRLIKGANHYLKAMSQDSGTLESDDFRIHWFFLKNNRRATGGLFPYSAFISTLYQNELYDTKRGSFAMKYYSLFGIYRRAVSKNVVVIVEPKPKTDTDDGVITDSARSRLIHTAHRGAEGLPWEVYAEFFRNNLPKPIADALEDVESDTYDNVNKAIENDLKHLIRDVRRPAFRRRKQSEESVDPNATGSGDFDTGQEKTISTTEGVRGNEGAGAVGIIQTKKRQRRLVRSYNVSANTGRTKAERRKTKSIVPTLRWVGQDDEEGLRGFVARYDKYNHILFINLDFSAYTELLTGSLKRHAETALEPQVVTAVQRVWGRFLAARILAVYAYRGSESWTENRWDNAVSPESLTMSVAGGYKMENDVSQILKHMTKAVTA